MTDGVTVKTRKEDKRRRNNRVRFHHCPYCGRKGLEKILRSYERCQYCGSQYQKTTKPLNDSNEEHLIPVNYLCWGCGSSDTRYEATDLPITAKKVWNICPQCVARSKNKSQYMQK